MNLSSYAVATTSIAMASILVSGCSSLGGSGYSDDPVLQQSAQEACELAKGMPNLGSNFNWQHSLSGDFDPNFTDVGTFEWGYLGERTPRRTYSFTCEGRFDDSHIFADAVLKDLSYT